MNSEAAYGIQSTRCDLARSELAEAKRELDNERGNPKYQPAPDRSEDPETQALNRFVGARFEEQFVNLGELKVKALEENLEQQKLLLLGHKAVMIEKTPVGSASPDLIDNDGPAAKRRADEYEATWSTYPRDFAAAAYYVPYLKAKLLQLKYGRDPIDEVITATIRLLGAVDGIVPRGIPEESAAAQVHNAALAAEAEAAGVRTFALRVWLRTAATAVEQLKPSVGSLAPAPGLYFTEGNMQERQLAALEGERAWLHTGIARDTLGTHLLEQHLKKPAAFAKVRERTGLVFPLPAYDIMKDGPPGVDMMMDKLSHEELDLLAGMGAEPKFYSAYELNDQQCRLRSVERDNAQLKIRHKQEQEKPTGSMECLDLIGPDEVAAREEMAGQLAESRRARQGAETGALKNGALGGAKLAEARATLRATLEEDKRKLAVGGATGVQKTATVTGNASGNKLDFLKTMLSEQQQRFCTWANENCAGSPALAEASKRMAEKAGKLELSGHRASAGTDVGAQGPDEMRSGEPSQPAEGYTVQVLNDRWQSACVSELRGLLMDHGMGCWLEVRGAEAREQKASQVDFGQLKRAIGEYDGILKNVDLTRFTAAERETLLKPVGGALLA